MKNTKIKDIKPIVQSKFVSLYEVGYKNKLDVDRTWMVTSRKDINELSDFYLNDKEDYCYKIIDYNGTEKQLDYYSTYCYIQYGNMFCEYDHKVVKVLEYERVECYE